MRFPGRPVIPVPEVHKRVVSKRVVFSLGPKTERGYNKRNDSHKTGTRAQKKEQQYQKPEQRYIRQNQSFTKSPFCFLSRRRGYGKDMSACNKVPRGRYSILLCLGPNFRGWQEASSLRRHRMIERGYCAKEHHNISRYGATKLLPQPTHSRTKCYGEWISVRGVNLAQR